MNFLDTYDLFSGTASKQARPKSDSLAWCADRFVIGMLQLLAIRDNVDHRR
jgi:hypothetical protein